MHLYLQYNAFYVKKFVLTFRLNPFIFLMFFRDLRELCWKDKQARDPALKKESRDEIIEDRNLNQIPCPFVAGYLILKVQP